MASGAPSSMGGCLEEACPSPLWEGPRVFSLKTGSLASLPRLIVKLDYLYDWDCRVMGMALWALARWRFNPSPEDDWVFSSVTSVPGSFICLTSLLRLREALSLLLYVFEESVCKKVILVHENNCFPWDQIDSCPPLPYSHPTPKRVGTSYSVFRLI